MVTGFGYTPGQPLNQRPFGEPPPRMPSWLVDEFAPPPPAVCPLQPLTDEALAGHVPVSMAYAETAYYRRCHTDRFGSFAAGFVSGALAALLAVGWQRVRNG